MAVPIDPRELTPEVELCSRAIFGPKATRDPRPARNYFFRQGRGKPCLGGGDGAVGIVEAPLRNCVRSHPGRYIRSRDRPRVAPGFASPT